MITVPEATKEIIERSRYLSEAISKGLINYSSLARYMKPEIEQILIKKVSVASIMMALKRLEPSLKPNYHYKNIFNNKPEILTRSNLVLLTVYNNTPSSLNINKKIKPIFKNQGINETSFIISEDQAKLLEIGKKDTLIYATNLSSISIKLPEIAAWTSGIYYFFLKSLAWEGINVIELSSTIHEFTIIVEDKDVERAFSIIKSLFSI